MGWLFERWTTKNRSPIMYRQCVFLLLLLLLLLLRRLLAGSGRDSCPICKGLSASICCQHPTHSLAPSHRLLIIQQPQAFA
ncbi:hypothetical protein IWZ01DRAFT_506675 [Phyllosticta capitalensis]